VRHTLAIDTTRLRPGHRIADGLSGGADSVALLRALAEGNHQPGRELGLELHAAHLHHSLRGAESDDDLDFSRSLARQLGIPFHHFRVNTAGQARPNAATGKPAESIEEAARRLRYTWFRRLLASGEIDAIATAHTLDDQAETVLAKFLRGAWTEGLSGIHPILEFPEGRILRPLLATTRTEIETYLHALGQPWREDSSNRNLTFTRNRIRHELLPLLETWNPRLREHLAHMADLARDEEAWWQLELARIAPQLILPGRPVRGGGRAATPGLALGLAIDIVRLAELPPAVQRRLLRHAAEQTGASLDFTATEALCMLALTGRASQKLELAQGLRAERSHRELRLTARPTGSKVTNSTKVALEYTVTVPGEVEAAAFSIHLRIDVTACPAPSDPSHKPALLRAWKSGDRVRVRHSSGPRKIKEVLERMKVTGSSRTAWPVLEIDGRIVWMKGIELEPEPGIEVFATPLEPLPSGPISAETAAPK
jgi:tRNA(Ile)-lysidine synthase